jgi:hypothetical protein
VSRVDCRQAFPYQLANQIIYGEIPPPWAIVQWGHSRAVRDRAGRDGPAPSVY